VHAFETEGVLIGNRVISYKVHNPKHLGGVGVSLVTMTPARNYTYDQLNRMIFIPVNNSANSKLVLKLIRAKSVKEAVKILSDFADICSV
jgi:hypothetical protein